MSFFANGYVHISGDLYRKVSFVATDKSIIRSGHSGIKSKFLILPIRSRQVVLAEWFKRFVYLCKRKHYRLKTARICAIKRGTFSRGSPPPRVSMGRKPRYPTLSIAALTLCKSVGTSLPPMPTNPLIARRPHKVRASRFPRRGRRSGGCRYRGCCRTDRNSRPR
jgi:hypothetical protein